MAKEIKKKQKKPAVAVKKREVKPRKTPEIIIEKAEPESGVLETERPVKPAAQNDLGEPSPRSLGEAGRPAGRDRYFEAVGRRKTAIARVRLFTRAGDFAVNGKPYAVYFPTLDLQKIAEDALQKMKLLGRFRVSAKISGGGIHAQAEALRHGLARCLVKFNPDFRKRLKRAGFLRRDPRMKERKKFGLKKARRAPQWKKR